MTRRAICFLHIFSLVAFDLRRLISCVVSQLACPGLTAFTNIQDSWPLRGSDSIDFTNIT